MCQLVAQKTAARILGQRRLTLLDRSIDYLKIPFDDRDSRGIELRLPRGHDLLKHVDLLAIDQLGMLLVLREAGIDSGPTRYVLILDDARDCCRAWRTRPPNATARSNHGRCISSA